MRNRLAKGAVWALLLAMLVCVGFAPVFSYAADIGEDEQGDDESVVYTVYGPDNQPLFWKSSHIYEDDEYISEDNKLYRIQSVDDSTLTARAELVGDEEMPDVGDIWAENPDSFAENNDIFLDSELSQDAEAATKKLVGMYCTHSDESYVPNDGVANEENGKGGIFDVAEALKSQLEKKGVTVTFDDSTHFPHDSGAYRRSRQTAVSLLKEGPVALFDIHRDAIPPEEYEKTINGTEASRVRLLVGRSNQNMAANKDFAKRIKAIADKKYPGMIKDIFIGKGNYNQELLPNSVLLEFGTHEMDKDRAIESTKMMADVINKTLFGAATSANTEGGGTAAKKNTSNVSTSSGGSATGIFWVLAIAAIGAIVYAFLSTGGKNVGGKLRDGASEITGGLIPRDDDKKDES